MNRDDITRWEAEIQSWRERYDALVKTMADSAGMFPPRLLADKESYELGRLHGAAAEREECAKVCDTLACMYQKQHDASAEAIADACAAAIRARGNA